MERASDSYRWMKMDTQKQKYRKKYENMSLSDSEELGMMLDSGSYHPPPGLNLHLMSTFSQRGLSMSSNTKSLWP